MPVSPGPGSSRPDPSNLRRAVATLGIVGAVSFGAVSFGAVSFGAGAGAGAAGRAPTTAGGQPDRTTPGDGSTSTTEDRTTPTSRGGTTTTDEAPTRTTEEPERTTTTDEATTTSEESTTTSEDLEPATTSSSGDDDGEGGAGPLMLVLGVLLGASAGAAFGWFAGRQAPGASSAQPASGAGAALVAGNADAVAQRATLVGAAIAAIDLAQNEGLREQLTRALEQAGVRRIAPDGETFDPARHHAVDRLPTHDPAQHNTVITDRPGWVDGGQVLRIPDVIVYRTD